MIEYKNNMHQIILNQITSQDSLDKIMSVVCLQAFTETKLCELFSG